MLTDEQRARLRALRDTPADQLTPEEAAELAQLEALAVEDALRDDDDDENPTVEASAAIARAVRDGLAAAFSGAGGVPLFGRQVIPAGGPRAQVREPLPYRFDGTAGEHDFSTDLFAAARFGKGEAIERLNRFMEDLPVQFANVATTDVDELNPPVTRADMYVDYVEKVAPVYTAIKTGAINDATPFYVPAYNSDNYLANDHTEGSEPANDGAFSTTKVTVTPAALDAAVPINREVIDAGGNPQVSALIWRQMQRRYAEQLEVKAAGILTGYGSAAELGASISAGATPEEVADAVEAGLIGLQFVQGGGLFEIFLGHQELFTAMGGARQTTTVIDSNDDLHTVVTGNKRYPHHAPTNTTGAAGARWSRLEVGGFDLTPAPALGGVGTGQKSYLLAAEAVGFWNSDPKRIDWITGVSAVNFGYIGYWAGAILNGSLIRKVTFDSTS